MPKKVVQKNCDAGKEALDILKTTGNVLLALICIGSFIGTVFLTHSEGLKEGCRALNDRLFRDDISYTWRGMTDTDKGHTYTCDEVLK